jgi:hypothetical protein
MLVGMAVKRELPAWAWWIIATAILVVVYGLLAS